MDSVLTIDLHGLTRAEALERLDAALKTVRGVRRIQVVHGYHSGTALKTAIANAYRNHPKVERVSRGSNPGETYLILKE